MEQFDSLTAWRGPLCDHFCNKSVGFGVINHPARKDLPRFECDYEMGSGSSVQTARHLAVTNLINKPTDLSDITTIEEAKEELKTLRSLAHEFRYEIGVKPEGESSKKAKRMNVMGNRGDNTSDSVNKDTKRVLPPTFDKSRDVRKILLEVAAHHVLFKNCTIEEQDAIVDAFEKHVVSKDDFVIRKGEHGEHFYVVETGTCSAWGEGQKVGGNLGPGASFGELALLYNQPRAVDIKASTEVVLWRIERLTFRQVVSFFQQRRTSAYLGSIRNITINGVNLGETLSVHQLNTLVSALERESYDEGDVVMRQGSHGDHFFIIESGAVGVHVEDDTGDVKRVNVLQSGDFFGEKALLSEDLRTASIIAENHVYCLTLSRQDFVSLIGTIDEANKEREFAKKEESGGQTQEEPAVAIEPFPLDVNSIDDFETKGVIGTGTWGTITLCRYKKSEEPNIEYYAIKTQSKVLLASHNLHGHVAKEINNLLEVSNCRFIAKLYAAFQDKKYIYHVMEFCSGGELYDFISNKGHILDTNKVRFYSACFLLALRDLHNKGIAYRDTKPENLCFDSNGYLKLVDFGMTKKLHGVKTFTICGTPDYIAPEVILAEGHNHAVDYWGLGILIYELLKGSPPFADDDDNAVKVYENILQNDIEKKVKAAALGKDVSNLLGKLICNVQTKRLGSSKKGSKAILDHKFYNNLNLVKLEKGALKAPILPPSSAAGTTDNYPEFDTVEHPEDIDMEFALR